MEQWRIEKQQLVKQYHEDNMTAVKGQVVFAGSSLMEMFPIDKWAKEYEGAPIVYNRGVGGYTTTDMLPILDICVNELKPSKLFINIGTNDLSNPSVSLDEMINNYDLILRKIEENNPGIVIYLMAYYPINYEAATEQLKPCLRIRTNEKIAAANKLVEALAAKHGHHYIDVNANLKDEEGRLKAQYTIEGMHIKPEGYRAILDVVMKYVLEK